MSLLEISFHKMVFYHQIVLSGVDPVPAFMKGGYRIVNPKILPSLNRFLWMLQDSLPSRAASFLNLQKDLGIAASQVSGTFPNAFMGKGRFLNLQQLMPHPSFFRSGLHHVRLVCSFLWSYPRVLVKMKYEKQELHRIRLIRIRPTIT